MGLIDQKLDEMQKTGISCWLMKSEPISYSINHLREEKKCIWDGVRNYQSRNFMQNTMNSGDPVLFYHSNTKIPGIVGLAKVAAEEPLPDPTQFDPESNYYDPKASPEKPIWYCVKIIYEKTLPRLISLNEIKSHPKLQYMLVSQKGIRLSIQPVTEEEYSIICNLK